MARSRGTRQQRGPGEAREVADLGAQSGGRQRVDPAKAAQPGDHRRVAAVGDLRLERAQQRRATSHQQLDRSQVVSERRVGADIVEVKRAQPRQVLGRPRAARPGVALAAAQQELPDAVTGAHQIAADVLDRAHQIAELLIGDRRHERERKLPGGQQPNQPHRVATVGLDTVTRPLRDRPRRRHSHVDPALTSRPRKPEPRRARLIHRAHRRPEPFEEGHHLHRRHPQLAHTQLTGSRFEHRRVGLTRVHVQADESHSVHRHGRFLLCGCGRRAAAIRAAIETPHDRVGDRPCLPTAPDVNLHRV
jgi:hypothetical protein